MRVLIIGPIEPGRTAHLALAAKLLAKHEMLTPIGIKEALPSPQQFPFTLPKGYEFKTLEKMCSYQKWAAKYQRQQEAKIRKRRKNRMKNKRAKHARRVQRSLKYLRTGK